VYVPVEEPKGARGWADCFLLNVLCSLLVGKEAWFDLRGLKARVCFVAGAGKCASSTSPISLEGHVYGKNDRDTTRSALGAKLVLVPDLWW